ncbi:alpha/beta hydrolase [Enemella evansiae]|uniref:alpha/beta hydrolase n=1 Tax=Enemella evansiae TaxID=2016499 RepID=UPI000B978C89|nr:alpha/beta hydrolase [Enemella evansiae]OYO18490.1 hypothetical protein BI335_07350 [Enemella evansiae]TDO94578.1 alpha/beta hydrolase family protein [Enemella evansiae]
MRARLGIGWLLALAMTVTGCSAAAPAPAPAPDPALFGTPQPAATRPAGEATAPDRPQLPIPEVTPTGLVDPPPGAGPTRYQQQRLDWNRCTIGNRAYECANALAPLDAERPDERAVTLALLKVPASRQPRLGTLFVNPGGPGEGGRWLAAGLQRTGLEQYDIVGWDPRGTGASTPVRCTDPAQTDTLLAADSSPDDEAERAAYRQLNADFGRACLANSGELLEHISTVDTVRDLDLLRGLVGDPKLQFLGYSYGTAIGSRYAQMYPDRVGAMVLDSAVNVIPDDQSVVQAMGFDRALTEFADWCAGRNCSLGSDRAAVLARITGLFDGADGAPIPAGGNRPLTQSLAVTGVISSLYGTESGWPKLLEAIEQARAGDGRALLEMADSYEGRSADGRYANRAYAFDAIRCLDRPDKGLAAADAKAEQETRQAPIFGRYFGPDYVCPSWPVPPKPMPGPVTAPGVPQILVIGTTGDSATPYEYAPRMARELGAARLLTYQGEGHAAYGGKSKCVDDAVVQTFTTGVPATDLTCS